MNEKPPFLMYLLLWALSAGSAFVLSDNSKLLGVILLLWSFLILSRSFHNFESLSLLSRMPASDLSLAGRITQAQSVQAASEHVRRHLRHINLYFLSAVSCFLIYFSCGLLATFKGAAVHTDPNVQHFVQQILSTHPGLAPPSWVQRYHGALTHAGHVILIVLAFWASCSYGAHRMPGERIVFLSLLAALVFFFFHALAGGFTLNIAAPHDSFYSTFGQGWQGYQPGVTAAFDVPETALMQRLLFTGLSGTLMLYASGVCLMLQLLCVPDQAGDRKVFAMGGVALLCLLLANDVFMVKTAYTNGLWFSLWCALGGIWGRALQGSARQYRLHQI